MNTQTIEIEPSWYKVLAEEFEKPYMRELSDFLKSELRQGKIIYPPAKEYFRAFALTPFDRVRVVILGQDPYHGPGQAHGLAFSVRSGVAHPPSLRNIFKELQTDLNLSVPKSGDLTPWAKQGVLLLNTSLSVEKGQAGSHANRGWGPFTDAVVHKLAENHNNLCFVLWGSHAQKKLKNVDLKYHYVLQSPHPSPLSAHRGFFGSRPFSSINAHLKKIGKPEVDWSL